MSFEHIPFNVIIPIARRHNVCPLLVAAIGQHETAWGQLGLGRYGFYTGYGAFDHAPDFRFTGLTRQIEGTARMMAEWGMRPNRVTLERLRRGNRGEFGRIYATDPYWADKVWRHYLRIRREVDLEDFPKINELDIELERDVELGWGEHAVRIIVIIILFIIAVFAIYKTISGR